MSPSSSLPDPVPPARGEHPHIPDHELLRLIGAGSYGEVWLARNAVGTWRAVKLVRRATFKSDRPYEREFSGMKKFEPVSRSHEGLVDLLQVGRNDDAGYFYYVMELADDAGANPKREIRDPREGRNPNPETPAPDMPPRTSGWGFPSDFEIRNSDSYSPCTLSSEARRLHRLPLADCLRHFLTLTSALETLHRAGLIHRDIKPSNIIIVGGVAKLADIGLVAAMDSERSFVGTEGFIPPEGPGTAQADIYSLGKVLYEVATGNDRKDFPSLPLGSDAKNPPRDLLELNAIMTRACAQDPKTRYATAAEMHADLAVLQAGRSVRSLHAFEARLRAAKRVGLVAMVIALVALGGLLLASWMARTERVARTQVQTALARAETAERDARDKLYESLVAGALAERRSGLIGRRFRALESIRRAAELRPGSAELRDAAISALALPDLREIRRWTLEAWASTQVLSADGEIRFVAHTNGVIHALRATNGVAVFTLGQPSAAITKLILGDRAGRWLRAYRASGPDDWWDLSSRQLARQLTIPFAADISADHRWLVATDQRQRVTMHDLASLASRELALPEGRFDLVRAGPDDGFLIGSRWHDTLRLVDFATGETGATFTTPNREAPNALGIGPDGYTLAVGLEGGRVVLYDRRELGKPRAVVQAHDSAVRGVQFHPDGDWCLTWGWDGSLRLLGTSEGEALARHRVSAENPVFSADGRHVGWRETDSLDAVWAAVAGRDVCRVLGESLSDTNHQPSPWNASFSPDGRLLAVACYDGLRLYETRSGRERAHFSSRLWYGVAFAGETNLYSAGPVGLAVWPLTWRGSADLFVNQRRYLESGFQWAVQSSAEGEVVVSAGQRGFTLLFADGTRTNIMHGASIRGANISHDGRRVVAAVGPAEHDAVWDTGSGELIQTFPGRSASGACFDPSGQLVAANYLDNVVVWDVASSRERWRTRSPRGAGQVAWSPDGRMVVAVRESMIPVLFDAATGAVLARLEHPDARPATGLAFSPDGSRLASLTGAHRTYLWDLRALRQALAALNLDWELPPLPPATIGPAPRVAVQPPDTR